MAGNFDLIDRSNEKTYAWLNDLTAELGTEDRREGYRALRAFLHLVRDRITPEEGAQLAAQLPHFLRGVFYEDWSPGRTPETYRDREELLDRMAEEAGLAGDTDASIAVEAAAKVLRRHISEGEYRDVVEMLPEALAPLFQPERV